MDDIARNQLVRGLDSVVFELHWIQFPVHTIINFKWCYVFPFTSPRSFYFNTDSSLPPIEDLKVMAACAQNSIDLFHKRGLPSHIITIDSTRTEITGFIWDWLEEHYWTEEADASATGTKDQHKCTCDMRDLMVSGCRCGGI